MPLKNLLLLLGLVLVTVHAQTPKIVDLGRLKLHICHESIIRVTVTPTNEAVPDIPRIVARKSWPDVDCNVTQSGDTFTVITRTLKVVADRNTLFVGFYDLTGAPLLVEPETAAKSFTPTTDLGDPAWVIEQRWLSDPRESLYGGGGYQNGLLGFNRMPLQLIQFNTEAVVPFFVSSKGYGLLWDNYAVTHLNPTTNNIPLNVSAGEDGGDSELQGTFVTRASGVHHFYVQASPALSFGGGYKRLRLVIAETGTTVIDWDNLSNPPASITGRASLDGNTTYTLKVTTDIKADFPLVFLQGPDYPFLTLRSDLGWMIDYHFMYGGDVDGSIGLFRQATGPAPMYSKSAYGFWQCE